MTTSWRHSDWAEAYMGSWVLGLVEDWNLVQVRRLTGVLRIPIWAGVSQLDIPLNLGADVVCAA